MSNLFYLGPLYPKENEKSFFQNLRRPISNAPNTYQYSLLRGFVKNGYRDIRILNALPIGTWPQNSKKIICPDRNWDFCGCICHEIGCINLPFVKQLGREWRTRKYLQKYLNDDDTILIYSAYLPFLRAIRKVLGSVHICAIITDLPEFYDLGNTGFLRKMLRKLNNKLSYKALQRMDSFVLLTEAMKEPLQVGDRPYVVVEGICPSDTENFPLPSPIDKKVIFYSGTLHYRYGIETLLDAFSLIQNRDAELWICGSGEAEKEIKEREKTDSRIKFFGFCCSEKVSELRSHATLLVNPRTNEEEYTKYSFPSKTMEYFASGIPVAMYRLSGIPDEYYSYCYELHGTEVMELAIQLMEILEKSNDEITEKGFQARSFIMNNKSAKIMGKRILDII